MTLDDLLLLVMVLGALWAVRVWIGDQVQRLIRSLHTPPIRDSERRAWTAYISEDLSSVSTPPPAEYSVNQPRGWVPESVPEPQAGTIRNPAPIQFPAVPGVGTSEPVPAPPEPTQWSEEGLIALLACQKRPDGSYRYTATQIAEFVGGRRQERLHQVAAYRGKAKPLPTINGAAARLGEDVPAR